MNFKYKELFTPVKIAGCTIKNRFAKVCLIILAVIISLFCDWALLAPIFTLLFVWANNSKHRTKIAFCLSIVIFGTFNFF